MKTDKMKARGHEAAFATCAIEFDYTSAQLAGFVFRMEQAAHGADGGPHIAARVGAFSDGEGRLNVLVGLDVLGVGPEITKALKEAVLKRLSGWREVGVDIVATHTHSAPALISLQRCGSVNSAWIQAVRSGVEKAVGELQFSPLTSVGRIVRRIPGVSYNRRRVLQDGTVHKAPELPDGVVVIHEEPAVDDALTVITFRDAHGEAIGCIAHFACHPSCCNSIQASCDYVGLLREAIARELGVAHVVFVQGCAGDVNAVRVGLGNIGQLGEFFREKWDPALKELAKVEQRLPEVSVLRLGGHNLNLRYDRDSAMCANVKQECAELRTAAEGGAVSERVKLRLANIMNMNSAETDEGRKRIQFAALALAEACEHTINAASTVRSAEMPISVWQFGGSVSLALAGCEPFQSTQRVLADRMLVGGYLSPCVGYMPPKEAHRHGGYEVCDAWRFYGHAFPFVDSCEQLVTQALTGLERDVRLILAPKRRRIPAKLWKSGFAEAHDTYNGIGIDQNGTVYFVLSSQKSRLAGQLYCLKNGAVSHVFDLDVLCDDAGKSSISHGKIHCPIFFNGDWLLLATHVGYYDMVDGTETLPIARAGEYDAYPGGCVAMLNTVTGEHKVTARAPNGEGILCCTPDFERGNVFFITWPSGLFCRADSSDVMTNYGSFAHGGEAVSGDQYRTLCRCIVVDPVTGNAFFTNADGQILKFNVAENRVVALEGAPMRLDCFGQLDSSRRGSMGYNWRQVNFYAPENCVYGVTPNGFLFRFDPESNRVQVVERIASSPSLLSGHKDMFTYGYLGFQIVGNRIFYLTGGPIEGATIVTEDVKRGAARGAENLHLVLFDLANWSKRDCGIIVAEAGNHSPTYCNSIAVSADGKTVFFLARDLDGRTELFEIAHLSQ